MDRDVLARLAEPNVAEVSTFVKTTGQLFIALDHTEMTTFRIRALLNRTTDVFAVMLLALLE